MAIRLGLGCVACPVVLVVPAIFSVHENLTYPAAIHTGSCEDPGEAVFGLDDLVRLPKGAPEEGEPVGAPDAQVVHSLPENSTIDATIEDLLAEDHVVAVFDPEDGETIIACGPIGAFTFGEDQESLAIGLREFNASNYTGVALFGDEEDADDEDTETETEEDGLDVEVYIVLNDFPAASPAAATPIG